MILVATDFSEAAEDALDYAVALAQRIGARICLLNAIGVPALGVPELGVALTSTVIDGIVKENQAALDRLVAARTSADIEVALRTGDARDVIVQTALEVGAELIVMGTHGRRGLSRALLGSVAESVLRHAHCPVLIIRHPKRES
jgi:nucleotide-binding universal stress UspA family protein